MVKSKNSAFFMALFMGLCLAAQELPPITSFYPQTYGGDDQNWSITQDDSGVIYVANNKGLLVYNGARWELYNTPNQSIMRSVHASGDRIYSGQFQDFGFWKKDSFGSYKFTSLISQYGIKPQEDEEFWGILSVDEWVIFQSLDRIYLINESSEQVEIIESESTISKFLLSEQQSSVPTLVLSCLSTNDKWMRSEGLGCTKLPEK